jgi:hypothetical protein
VSSWIYLLEKRCSKKVDIKVDLEVENPIVGELERMRTSGVEIRCGN